MIMRIWRGWVATERRDEYVGYIERTGLAEYRSTEGNSGAQMVVRDLEDGTTEVLTLSWWETIEAVRAFAGDDEEVAKYYLEDEQYLVRHDDIVTHYDVAAVV
jgi:heme-degrading monooxygenase HmoA